MEEENLNLKIKAYELQELIAKAVQNYVEVIALAGIDTSDLQIHDEFLKVTKIASSNFKQWFDLKNLKTTTEATLNNIRSLEKTSTHIQTLGNLASLPKAIQDISYYLNNLQRNEQEISSWLAKNDIQTLQDHWYKNQWYLHYKLLNEVFHQATFRIRSLELLTETHKNFEANNQKSKKLINDIESLKKQSEEIAKDTINKSRIAEDTRTAIEKAIKVKLNEKYENQAEKLKKEETRWTRNVSIGLLVLFLIGLYEIATLVLIYPRISLSPYQLLGFIPIHLAIIWFIIFSINRRNEASRLACDYAHKEVFASSYLAYQNEINELKGKHTPEVQELITQLNVKLIDSMIDTLADNPAKNLDSKKKSSEFPTKEIINLVNEVTKIKNFTPIPQISIPQPQQEKGQTQ